MALAAATAEVDGTEAGLALIDEADRFQPAAAVRAHLLARLGRTAEATAAYDRAIELTTDPAERDHLRARRADLNRRSPDPHRQKGQH